jgi:hypothetical protein
MQLHQAEFPRLVIAALRGGSGKTIVSIGIIAALRGRGNLSPLQERSGLHRCRLASPGGRPALQLAFFCIFGLIRRPSVLTPRALTSLSSRERASTTASTRR